MTPPQYITVLFFTGMVPLQKYLGCCPFLGGGSVVVDFLFFVTPIVGVCNVICFVVRYFMSILVLQSS